MHRKNHIKLYQNISSFFIKKDSKLIKNREIQVIMWLSLFWERIFNTIRYTGLLWLKNTLRTHRICEITQSCIRYSTQSTQSKQSTQSSIRFPNLPEKSHTGYANMAHQTNRSSQGVPWFNFYTEKSFRNFIKSTRNQIVFTIFRLIWNSKRTASVCCSKSIRKWWIQSDLFLV